MTDIVSQNHATIIDKWLKQEQNGDRFPADFEYLQDILKESSDRQLWMGE